MPDSVVVSLVVLLFVLAVSAVGTVLYLRRERRRPSSYRSQAAYDEAALHAGEAAEAAAARMSGLPRP